MCWGYAEEEVTSIWEGATELVFLSLANPDLKKTSILHRVNWIKSRGMNGRACMHWVQFFSLSKL